MTMNVTLDDSIAEDEAGKIFVGGLSWETSQEKLTDYFNKYGDVVDCCVMKNNDTGRSRGFGFVTFKDPASVGKVLCNGPHMLDDRTIDPKVCNTKMSQKGKKNNLPKVFLGGLPVDCTETDIRAFFSRYGTVIEVVLMYDQEKKKPRGFGFLSFEKEESVKQVCAEHFVKINGKKVECKHAEPRDKNSRPQTNTNQPTQNQWGSAPGMSGPGSWGPPPGAGGGPMPGGWQGWQGGWGPGPQGYGPQGGWGPQQGYGPGYQNWGGPAYGPYGGPGPNYGQNYGPGGYGNNYGNNSGGGGGSGGGSNNNYNGPQAGGPQQGGNNSNNGPQPSGDGYAGQGPGAPAGQIGGPQSGPSGGGGTGNSMMSNYSQDNSNYGPSRGYSGGGGGGYGGSGPSSNYGSGGGSYGSSGDTSSSVRVGAGGSTGYHPYRR